MITLEQVTTPTGDTLAIPEGWSQQKGAYGGLVVAACVRAVEAKVGDPRRKVRAVTAEIPAPTLPGTVTVETEILRSGNNLTVARAALRQGPHVTAHAVVTLAADRDNVSDLAWNDLTPPSAPAWDTLPLAPIAGAGPEFAQHFDYKVVAGIPFTGGAPSTIGWVRARAPGAARDAAYLAAMIDVWFPGTLVKLRAPRPMATIAYTLEILGDASSLAPDEPLLYRGHVPVAGSGYYVETRELWTRSGQLLARNHQTFAIIK
jgi:acyl-CoA thioesterase